MFENIAAIDIGSTAIRAVAVKTGFKEFQVKFLSMEEIDQNNPDWKNAASQALRRLIDDNDLSQYDICATIPMEQVLIRNLTFPFSDITKIASVLPSEAEEQMPLDPEKLVLDFKPLYPVDEGTAILAAGIHQDTLDSFLGIFEVAGVRPSFMGLEAISLFETYRYFNPPADESAIILNIGNRKSIIAIIEKGSLIYTRAVQIGTGDMDRAVADILDISETEAYELLCKLQIDLASVDNNVTRGHYSELELSKPVLKKIYNTVYHVAEHLHEEMLLTLGASPMSRTDSLARILICGGGASIMGIGAVLASDMSVPVVPLPFIDELKNNPAGGRFAIGFGTVLTCLNHTEKRVDFLQGRFAPVFHAGGLKSYYLAMGLGVLSLAVILFMIIFNSILSARINSRYDVILEEKFRRYFHAKPSGDPIDEARKLVKREGKETGDLAKLITSDDSVMDLLHDVISAFPEDRSFDLQNIVINDRILRLDGSIGSSATLDVFKQKLEEFKSIESVSLNIRYSRKNEVKFSMTIKQKLAAETSSSHKEES